MNKKWIKAAVIRAVKTAAQVLLASMSYATTISEVDWEQAVGIIALATLYSILTSIVTGLPEVENIDKE